MDLRFVTPTGLKEADPTDLAALLGRDDGFVWLDFTNWTPADAEFLGPHFGFHPVALDICGTPIRCRWCTVGPSTCSWCCTGRWSSRRDGSG